MFDESRFRPNPMPVSLAPAAATAERLVTVFGAAGFIGRFVVTELLRHDWRVRAFVRPSEENPFAREQGVEIVRGDVRDAAAVHHALSGATAAVNLAGAKSDEPESEAVNVGGVQHIVAAAHAHGGTRIIHFSTQAVKIARPGIYARTKLAADRLLETSGLPFTILRPSIVYGPGPSGVFSTMERCIARLPIVPVLGDGQWVSAPIHVADVAQAVVACLVTPATIGRCYDLAGPDSLTLDALIDRIAGRHVRKLHVPFQLALIAARVAVCVFPRAPISVSNVLGSNQPIPIDRAPAFHDFDFRPLSLDDGLQRMASEMSGSPEADALLAEEAQLFARYLLEVDLDPTICDRYISAVRARFASGHDGDLAFVRKHRWALPLIDAAAAVFRPRSQVRRRVFLMAALLETSPRHAAFFLAPPPPRGALVFGLVTRGITSGAKLLAGSLLLPFIRRHAAGS